MLKKMGWGGAGLGAKEQGIEQPISGGEVSENLLNSTLFHKQVPPLTLGSWLAPQMLVVGRTRR